MEGKNKLFGLSVPFIVNKIIYIATNQGKCFDTLIVNIRET